MRTSANSQFLRALGIVLLTLLAVPAFPQSAPPDLRYKLHAGDRLMYREVFDKEGKSPEVTFHYHVLLANQLLVIDEAGGRPLVGVQRNRQWAEMTEFHEHGKDTLAQQKPAFQERIAKRPVRFADTNLFSPTGQTMLPPQMLREANSKMLYGITELMPLPASPAHVGSEWDLGLYGLRMKLERFEPVDNESCAVIADTGTHKDTHLQYTFCPSSGHLVRLTFDGRYPELDSTMHEQVTLELREVHHQETLPTWLADPLTQMAALRAIVATTTPLPGASVMDPILTLGAPEAQALALAAYYQRGIAPKPEILDSLLQSQDADIRRIAARFSQPLPKPAVGPCELPAAHYGREKSGTTLRGMTSSGYAGVPYMIHVPLDYRGDQPFPLVVYLSGGGGLAFDAALNVPDAITHGRYLALYPHAGGDLWWNPKPTEQVNALLLEILRTYNIDTNHVYLVGFSNGGTAAMEYGARWPERLAAIASLMGAGMYSPSGSKLPMQNLLDVPVLFVHGDKDQRIPSSASVGTYDELRNLKPNVPPVIHILQGRPHDVTLSTDDGYTMPFFERFTRDPFPRTVSATIFDPKFPRQYWMEVAAGDHSPWELQGHISGDNLIDIKTHNVKQLRLLLRPELFDTTAPVRIRLNGKDQPPVELKHDCQLFQRSAATYVDPFLAYTDEIVLDIPK